MDYISCLWFGDGAVNTVRVRGELAPKPFTTLAGTIKMQAALNKGSEPDLTKPVNLDGLATIQMIYL